MPDSVNKFEIKGTINKEPELRVTANSCVAKWILPIETEGDDNVKPYWLQISCWGKLGEEMVKLPLGTEVVAVGRLRANRWTGTNGVEHSSLQMVANRIMVWKGFTEQGYWLPTGRSDMKGGGVEEKSEIATEGNVAVTENVSEPASRQESLLKQFRGTDIPFG